MARWKKKELEFLIDKVEEAQEEGTPLDTLFEEIAGRPELGGRSKSAISQKYYEYVKVKEEDEKDGVVPVASLPSTKPLTPATPANVAPTPIRGARPGTPKESRMKVSVEELLGMEYDWEVLEAFEGLPDFIRSTMKEVETLKARVEEGPQFDFFSFLSELVDIGKRLESVETLEKANAIQREENERLREHIRDLEGRLARIAEEYKAACDWFEVFMNSSSVKQMMSMGEIKHNMQTTLDRWGNVLKVEFIEVRDDEYQQAAV